jgi:hypothetical protein
MEMRTTETVQFPLVGFWDWEISPCTFSWSEQLHSLHGTDPTGVESIFGGFLGTVHPDDRPVVAAIFSHSRKTRSGFTTTHKIKGNGECIQEFKLREIVIKDKAGEVVRMVGSAKRKKKTWMRLHPFPNDNTANHHPYHR